VRSLARSAIFHHIERSHDFARSSLTLARKRTIIRYGVGNGMKREQFLIELRKYARAMNAELEVTENRGKGSHYRIMLIGKRTTLMSGDLSPQYIKLVKKQLGIK
jgi:hypothetical protein